MPSPAPPVAVTPLGHVSAATVLWRMRGQRYLTAVVKATFALVPEGRMTLVEPDPIALDEQPDPTGHGIRAAGDVAPFLNQADVWVTGHAELPPHFSEAQVHVWLAVVQGGQVRIDKRLDLSRREEAQARVPIDGLGPLSRTWPRRSQFLRGLDPARLHGPALDIPDGLDWTYFQAVPADQRMEPLTADAWVVLGGMVLRRPKLRTELPDAHAVARLYRREQAHPRAGEPIALRADMLQIDMDRRCCAIVWRGHAGIGAADPASLRVVAALAAPGASVAWVDPFAGAAAPATPFESKPPRAAPPRRPADPAAPSGAATAPIDPAAVVRRAAAGAMPFERPKVAPAPSATPTAAPTATPAAAAPRRAIPEVPASLEGTVAIDTSARVHAPATPFEATPRAPEPPPPKPPAPPIPATAPLLAAAAPQPSPWTSQAPGSSAAPPLPAAPATAPAFVAHASPPLASPAPVASLAEAPAAPAIGPDELAAWSPGLGAEFLAAMADAGALR